MGAYQVIIRPSAEKDLVKHKKAGDTILLKKITAIIKDLEEHPYSGIGHPEPLKHEFYGLWSRRINQKHRIIYEVIDEVVTVYVISAFGHYGDK
jgi:toxin YoeB